MRHLAVGGLIGFATLGQAALAQDSTDFPTEPITLVVPFSASGSPPNVLARELGQQMEEEWDQPTVVENRPGAAGQIAAQYVAGNEADGHTLLMGSVATQVIGPLMRDMPLDPAEAFVPVSQFGYTPMLISANADTGIESIEELVEQARAEPGSLSYMSVGVGSAAHLAAEMLQNVADIELKHVPYDGIGQAKLDLVSGEVDIGFSNIISMVQFIEEGSIDPLAVTDTKRVDILPDVPAIAETHPEGKVQLWWGLYAPSGTPDDVLDMLSAQVNEMVSGEELVADFADGGATLVGTSPEDLRELGQEDSKRWAEVIEAAGIGK